MCTDTLTIYYTIAAKSLYSGTGKFLLSDCEEPQALRTGLEGGPARATGGGEKCKKMTRIHRLNFSCVLGRSVLYFCGGGIVPPQRMIAGLTLSFIISTHALRQARTLRSIQYCRSSEYGNAWEH